MAFDEILPGHGPKDERVTVEVEEVLVDRDDKGAILIATNEFTEGIWFPRSVMKNLDYNQAGDLVSFEIPEWVAIDRGLV